MERRGEAVGVFGESPKQEYAGIDAGRWPGNVVLSHTAECKKVGTRKVKSPKGAADYTITGKQGPVPIARNVRPCAHFGDANNEETIDKWKCAPGCAVAELDRQSGELAGGGPIKNRPTAWMRGSRPIGMRTTEGYNDIGGASRFFNVFPIDAEDLVPFMYEGKAQRSEREAGCGKLPARSGADAVDREEGTDGLKSPRAGAGRTADKVRNHHPTCKPVAVMRWLCKLVTPPAGTVLDPFTGSGSTGVAALWEGFRFIGCELEDDYHPIAIARMEHAEKSIASTGPWTRPKGAFR
jgi:hypothetical protein